MVVVAAARARETVRRSKFTGLSNEQVGIGWSSHMFVVEHHRCDDREKSCHLWKFEEHEIFFLDRSVCAR